MSVVKISDALNYGAFNVQKALCFHSFNKYLLCIRMKKVLITTGKTAIWGAKNECVCVYMCCTQTFLYIFNNPEFYIIVQGSFKSPLHQISNLFRRTNCFPRDILNRNKT